MHQPAPHTSTAYEGWLIVLSELKQMKLVIKTATQDMKATMEKVVDLLDR